MTVSRVLNNALNVNPQTRERVEQAIADLQYLPNLAARSLRSRQSQTIAVVVPDITNIFWTTVARGVEDAAQKRNYSVLLGNTDENPEKQRSYLRAMMQQRVDGVIIAPYNRDAELIRPLREQKIPVVVIDRRMDGWEVDSVRGDSVAGACALVEHLVGLGKRRIAMITGPRGASTAEDRAIGYLLALKKAGIRPESGLMRWGEFRAIAGEKLAEELFTQEQAPEAIFAGNNQIALGVLEYLLKRGLRVPQDAALVCFDEMADAARAFQFFTVAAQPAYKIGEAAADVLFERIGGDLTTPVHEIVLPGHLVLRTSCGRLLNEKNNRVEFPFGLSSGVETREIPPLSGADLLLLDECRRELTSF